MAERVEFEPTVRLPVQRFSSSMILVLNCTVQSLSVCSSGIFIAPILSCDAWYRAVMHSWFATWFANSIHRLMSGFVGISARYRLFNLKPLDIIASSQP